MRCIIPHVDKAGANSPLEFMILKLLFWNGFGIETSQQMFIK